MAAAAPSDTGDMQFKKPSRGSSITKEPSMARGISPMRTPSRRAALSPASFRAGWQARSRGSRSKAAATTTTAAATPKGTKAPGPISSVHLLPAEMQSAIREGSVVASPSKQDVELQQRRFGAELSAAKLPMTKQIRERAVSDKQTLIPPAWQSNTRAAVSTADSAEPSSFLARTARTLNNALSTPQRHETSTRRAPERGILPPTTLVRPGPSPGKPTHLRLPPQPVAVLAESIDVTATPSRLSGFRSDLVAADTPAGPALDGSTSTPRSAGRSPQGSLRLRITALEAQNASLRLKLRDARTVAAEAREEAARLRDDLLRRPPKPAPHPSAAPLAQSGPTRTPERVEAVKEAAVRAEPAQSRLATPSGAAPPHFTPGPADSPRTALEVAAEAQRVLQEADQKIGMKWAK